jgi:hypothetical protein
MATLNSPLSGQMTSGDKWKAPRPFPLKLAIAALIGALLLGTLAWALLLRGKATEAVAPVASPITLTAVDVAGVGALLNQFSTTAHEIRGEVSEGEITANITGSVTADGKFGFGTINAANVDASTLLAEGATYIKGSPTFWSAVGVQTNFPGWVKVDPNFLGGRVYYPAQTVSAALSPVKDSQINADEYLANENAKAKFGPNGLETVELPSYKVSVLPASNDGVFGTARPMFDAVGNFATLNRDGSSWSVKAPPPGPNPPPPGAPTP